MSANVKNIMTNANLTEAEGKNVLDNLAVASELLPFFKDRLSSDFSSEKEIEENNMKESEETLSSKFSVIKNVIHMFPIILKLQQILIKV